MLRCTESALWYPCVLQLYGKLFCFVVFCWCAAEACAAHDVHASFFVTYRQRWPLQGQVSSRSYNSRIRNATLLFGVVAVLESSSGPMRDVIRKHFRLTKVCDDDACLLAICTQLLLLKITKKKCLPPPHPYRVACNTRVPPLPPPVLSLRLALLAWSFIAYIMGHEGVDVVCLVSCESSAVEEVRLSPTGLLATGETRFTFTNVR